jgi:anhydro-N-acetylmuramic acid kinase
MSGTSADGVGVAIVDVGRRRITLRAFQTVPYPPELHSEVLNLSEGGRGRVDDLCRLNFVLGEVFASALLTVARTSRVPLDTIDLIGSHGQTVCHMPRGKRFGKRRIRSTLQIGEPCVIAERTGVTTVADFRVRDLAAGGEGAPLVPYADFVLFRHPKKSRCVQNIGGIANVTYLPAGCTLTEVVAFDTGPGNMVIDSLTQLVSRGKSRYDASGLLAARGRVNPRLLAELMRHGFLRRKPPKSTGREEFGRTFSEEFYARARGKRIPPLDVLATATAFTAASIADAYERFLPGKIDEVILSGGGAHNRTLVSMLDAELGRHAYGEFARRALSASKRRPQLLMMDQLGISVDAREAVSFAILAHRTIRGLAGNVPSATGARRRVILGKIIPADRVSGKSSWKGTGE